MQKKGIDKKQVTRRKNKVYKIKQVDVKNLESRVQTYMQQAPILTLLPSWSMFCKHLQQIVEVEFPDKQPQLVSLLQQVNSTGPADTSCLLVSQS